MQVGPASSWILQQLGYNNLYLWCQLLPLYLCQLKGYFNDDDDELFLWYGRPTKGLSRDHCQRSSPSRISDMLQAGFEPVQNLSSGFAEVVQ